jgi:hypothetical protein
MENVESIVAHGLTFIKFHDIIVSDCCFEINHFEENSHESFDSDPCRSRLFPWLVWLWEG